LKQYLLGTTKFEGYKNLGVMPPWLQAWHKAKVTSKFQQICRLLTVEIVVLEHIFDSDP